MKDITPQELKQRLSQHELLHIIDVREPWEYEQVNIGGQNIPLTSLPSNLVRLNPLKKEEIIVHCKSGVRSEKAKFFLRQQGFLKIRNLIEGIEGFLKLH